MHIVLIFIVIAVVGVGASFFVYTNRETERGTEPISENEARQQTIDDNPEDGFGIDTSISLGEDTQTFADGTYTKVGTYRSPAGNESVSITLTLENDIVTSAFFEGTAENPASVRNQEKFAQGYEAVVVGKPIDSIQLTVVNGSSLTPIGFMEALTQIKTEARS